MVRYKVLRGEQIPMTPEEERTFEAEAKKGRAQIAREKEYAAWQATRPTDSECITAMMHAWDRMDQNGASLGQEMFETLQKWKKAKSTAVPKPEGYYDD